MPPIETLSEKRRAANAARKTFGGGGARPGAGGKRDPTKPRCNCGAMTAKRAKARAHKC